MTRHVLNADDGHILRRLDIPEIEIFCDAYLYICPAGALQKSNSMWREGRNNELPLKCV